MTIELEQNSLARLKVCYVDGSWTHDLCGDSFATRIEAERVTLRIKLSRGRGARASPARGALDEFLVKRHLIESIQIGKTAIRKLLRESLQKTERPDLSVALAAGREAVTYPASVTFGPDAVTLTLG